MVRTFCNCPGAPNRGPPPLSSLPEISLQSSTCIPASARSVSPWNALDTVHPSPCSVIMRAMNDPQHTPDLDTLARYEALKADVEYHSRLYYLEARTEITDQE